MKRGNYKIKIDKVINPFYLFGVSYSVAIILYLLRWSKLYPDLSLKLIIFLLVTFVGIGLFSYSLRHLIPNTNNKVSFSDSFTNIMFAIIVVLGIIDVSYEGYIPILKENFKYREFGMPILDFFFYSLSIYFAVHFFYYYLISKKIRLLIFSLIITLFQLIIFRRYSFVLIILTCIFISILLKKEYRTRIIIIGIILFVLGSFLFGYYGRKRNQFQKEAILSDFEASKKYRDTFLGADIYMTYLYISSPLANLQLNINKNDVFLNQNEIKGYIFYTFIPINITSRIEEITSIESPNIVLIHNNLMVGTYYLKAFYFFGWPGMIILNIFLIAYISILLLINRKNFGYNITSYAFLSTTATLLIFDNLLIKPDIIFILFIYPVVFSNLEYYIKKYRHY